MAGPPFFFHPEKTTNNVFQHQEANCYQNAKTETAQKVKFSI